MSIYPVVPVNDNCVRHDIPLGIIVDPLWIAGKPFMFLPFDFFDMYIDDRQALHRYHSGISDINRIEWLGEMAEFMRTKNLRFNQDFVISFMWQRMVHSQYYWYGIRFLDDTIAVEFKLKFGNYEPPLN